MDLGLAGQVVAVFGAARGIGEAIAGAFMAESANVAAIDRDPGVMEVAEQLPLLPPAWPAALADHDDHLSLGLVADVTDFAAVRRAAESVHGYFGRCDHVVFAVGVGSGKFGFPFWNLEPADWEPVLRVNLLGAVNVAHAFAPILVRGEGRHDALPLLGRRPDRLADRPALQRREGRADQLRPVRRQGPGPARRAGQLPLPGHGQDPAQPLGLGGLEPPAARDPSGNPTTSGPPTRSRSSSR